ncbi:uncharacterized protein KRP23_6043 [Phytophthora ramorum]|uniref:uncharacterized protein n=1 Tax=Phytophthora ramorum TaxID=164328 RepID=UPI0030B45C5B|nr:hypothetical protein KRP23_6043 [Phytophthora ramorum]
MAPISKAFEASQREWPASSTGKSPKDTLDCKKWGNVKTWTFAQLLASSFAKVSLEDAMRNGGNSPNAEKKKPASSGNNDWDCSYSCLKAVPPTSSSSTAPSSGNNDWNCSYSSLKAPPPISASSSSSTLVLDADVHLPRHSLEELLQHEETVEETEEEGLIVCRDPTRYVFDIVRIIGSGSYGTVLLCRLRACPNRLFAVKVVYKSKLGSISGLNGDKNAGREARRLLTEKKVSPPITPTLASELDTSNFEDQFTSQQVEGHLVYEEREPQGALSDEEDNHFYFGDFDWCADASHFE